MHLFVFVGPMNRFPTGSLIIRIFLLLIYLLLTVSLCARPVIKFRERSKIKYYGPTQILLAKGFRFSPPERRSFRTKAYKLNLYARSFDQGNLVYLEIRPAKKKKTFIKPPRIFLDKRKIPISAASWGYRALFGISPVEKVGQHILAAKVFVEGTPSRFYEAEHRLNIRKTKFPVSRSRIYIQGSRKTAAKRMSRKKRLKIRRFARQKRQAFRRFTNRVLIQNRLSHPRNKHFITSHFWAKRYVARYKRIKKRIVQISPRKRIHKGLDLRARWGEAIYAMAAGEVVLSQKMHYEGNFILINHGQGIFSGYMHLQKRFVYRGNRVRAGQQIGKAGATGAVTGAHLHLLLYVRSVPVDPLSLLALPIRK